jgi:hypothetical protein
MNRSTVILLAALAASLAWAYGSTRRSPVPAEQATQPVWKVASADIKQASYQSGETRVRLTAEPRANRPGRFLWIEGEGLPAVQPLRRSKKRKPQQPQPPTQDAFQGGPPAQGLLEEIANLQAIRVLGAAKDFKLEDFGLGGSNQDFLVLDLRGGTSLRLELGTLSAGNAARYVLSAMDNRVYLVRNAPFRRLSNPRRMMDRELFPFPPQEAQQLEIETGGRRLVLHRLNLSAKEVNRWGHAAGDAAGDPALQQVVNALVRIKAVRYLPENLGTGQGAPGLTVTALKSGEPPAVLRIYADGKEETPARSDHTVRPVALNKDLIKVLREKTRAVMK